MPIGLSFSMSGYKHFVQEFRKQCDRTPGGVIDVNTSVEGMSKAFRFRRSDEYLTHIDNNQSGNFVLLTEKPVDQGHYQNMAKVDTIDKRRVIAAFQQNFAGGYSSWSASLRVVVFFTAEAARSHVIYRAAQSVLQGSKINYSDYEPYLTSYSKNRDFNGLAQNQFRPLDDEDYRHPSFLLENPKRFPRGMLEKA